MQPALSTAASADETKPDFYKFRHEVKQENIELKEFKFSIEHKREGGLDKNIKLDNAEVCYLAFEELIIPASG